MRLRYARPLSALFVLSWGVALAVACSDSDSGTTIQPGVKPDASTTTPPPTGADASVADSSTNAPDSAKSDAGADAANAVERGPKVIAFAGDANGLYWSYGTSPALYIADEANDRISKWTDKDGFSTAAELPTASGGKGTGGLGQVVHMLDGTLLVTRFGFGTEGAVVIVRPDGGTGLIPNLDPARRRLGVGLLLDGGVVDSYFTKDDAGPQVGAVATLTLTGVETPFVTGLTKPVGVILNDGKLFITDQTKSLLLTTGLNGGVYKPVSDAGVVDAASDASDDASADAAPADASSDAATVSDAAVKRVDVVATLDQPDLLSQGPDGSLFAGSKGGTIYQIARDGSVKSLVTGLKVLHGVAYDGVNKRLFVAEHDPADAGAVNALRIYPID